MDFVGQKNSNKQTYQTLTARLRVIVNSFSKHFVTTLLFYSSRNPFFRLNEIRDKTKGISKMKILL